MKKLVSCTVLILFLFMNGGYYLYFMIRQFNLRQEIKRESQEYIDKEDLSLIVVPVKEEGKLNWIRKNMEFRYHGEMYDVVRSEIHGGKKYFYCIKDIQEQHLITKLNSVQKKQNKKIWKLRRMVSFKYFPAKYALNNRFNAFDILFSECNLNYCSIFREVATPPPRPYNLS
ncbi:MAG: hypothetical protein J7K46_07215 [Bacteroidales bacterium]|nr:hypothetical protein [Bacteroidales bacterium]